MAITWPAPGDTGWGDVVKNYINNAGGGIPLASFGAVADGVTDDTAAINSAIASGNTLNWGGPGHIYKITGTLAVNLSRDAVWVSNGARINLASAAAVQQMIAVTHNGFSMSLLGSLVIDAASKAYQGWYADNSNATTANINLNNLSVVNVRRSGTTFSGGDGIYIQGNFDRIRLVRPTVRNVTMANGTHTVGVQGVTGITVKSSSTSWYWHKLDIVAPLIDGVYSDDLTDLADQDGIRVMAAEDQAGLNVPYPSTVWITEGEFRNCCGRAIKSQAEFTYVRNITIYRTRTRYTDSSLTTAVRGGTDIDFQVGGGILDGLYAEYTNDAPLVVVQCTGPATATKTVPHSSVSRIRVLTSGATVPQVIVQQAIRTEAYNIFRIDDVEAVGSQPDTMLIFNGLSGSRLDAFVSRISGAPTLAGGQPGFVATRIDGWSGGKLYFEKMINRGASAVRMIGSPSTNVNPNVEISARECSNFLTSQKALDQGRNVDGPIARVDALGPAGVLKSGVARPAASTVADGATWALPPSYLTSYTGLLLVSVDGDANGQGLFAVSTAGVTTLAAGSAFTVGATAEPTSGTYRLWGTSTGPSISNHSGAPHTVTVLMFG